MISAVIVEDSKNDYYTLKECIDRFAEESGEQFTVKHYTATEPFFAEYECDADIIFMDIELPNTNGYEASEKLRNIDENVQIVFVTNLAHFAVKGYAVGAADFIVKPVNYYKLQSILKKLLRFISERRDDYISLHSAEGIARVSLRELIYIESEKHKITWHTLTQDIITFGTLGAVMEKLPESRFIKVGQSFIVNLRHIIHFDGDCIKTVSDAVISVSRSKKKEVMKKLSEYCLHGTGRL